MRKKKVIRGAAMGCLPVIIIIAVIIPVIIIRLYIERTALIRNRIKSLGAPTYLKAGTFMEFPNNYRLFIYEIEGNNLKKVRVFDHNYSPRRVIMAERGEYKYDWIENNLKLVLFDGTKDEPYPEKPDTYYKVRFRKYYLVLDVR